MDPIFKDKIDVLLNSVFECENRSYRCVINLFGDCRRCDFKDTKMCKRMNCANHLRKDKLSVMFIEESKAPDIPGIIADLQKATARYLEWTDQPTM